MKHLNDNIICAIDIETTGPMPGFHDLVAISIVPTVGFKIDKRILPLDIYMRPRRPENYSPQARPRRNTVISNYIQNGIDSYTAASVFDQWYEKLRLKEHKRILPLSYNWTHKAPFVMDWLSNDDDGRPYYFDAFDKVIVRDLSTMLQYWNDVACVQAEHFPFTKQRLHMLAEKLGVHWTRPSTPLSRCFAIIEVWQKLLQLYLPSGIDLPFKYAKQIDYSQIEEYADED